MGTLRACIDCSRPSEHSRCPLHSRGETTAERGYGWEHQRARAEHINRLDPSTPCPRCGEPLGSDPDVLDLGHTDDRLGYAGLEHLACNRGKR